MGRFALSYPRFSPASTVLNAGIAGDTVEAILYRVEVMNIPSSVSNISLLCGTNNLCSHSPTTISATLTEILFLLRRKCPTAYIHLFPILPRFDHLQKHVAATNSCIFFQVQELFPEYVFFHELPSTLFNQNLYRPDKIHLTTKGNDILAKWFHHCLTTSNSIKPEPTTPPMPSLQDVPSALVITDIDWPPLPAPSQPSNLTPPACTPTSLKPGPVPSTSVPSPTQSVSNVRPKPSPTKCSSKPCCIKLKSSPGQPRSKTSLNQLSPCHHSPKPTSSQPKLKFSCPKSNPKPNPTQPKPKANPSPHYQKPSPTQHSTKCSPTYPILKLNLTQPRTKPSPDQPNHIPLPRPNQLSQISSPTQPGKKLSSTKPSSKPGSTQPSQKCCAAPPSLKPYPAQPCQKKCSSQSSQKPCSIYPRQKFSPTQPIQKANCTQPSQNPSDTQTSEVPKHTEPEQMPTQLHSESEPDAFLPKADEDESSEVRSSDVRFSPKQTTCFLRLPSGTTLFLLYLQLCFPIFILVTLAQCDIVFLAVILPFPILITTALYSVCFIDMSHPANDDQNIHCKTDKTEEKSNKQIQENKLSSKNKDELNEHIIRDEDSEDICISILTFIKALLCILILYECQFNFIEHQPFGTLLCRGILATVLRVQCSLIIISMHVLPEKIVGSLVGIYEQQNNKDDFPKQKTCSDSFLTFLHIMRFRTLKHKKQRLVLNKNWKHALNRISNFQKKLRNHSCSVKNRTTKTSESNKTNKITLCSLTEINIIQYLVFSLSVISLPGLIILYLVIPKIQIFTKFLYNLSDDWLENVVLSHSYLFSTHHYLYVSSVIFGNMAINSFCTAILLETFPALSGTYILLVSIHPMLQEILQFCSFTSLTCVYFMLLYVGEYGLILLIFFFSSLFQFTSECFSLCNFWSFSTLLGIFSIFEYVLVDLFNIFLSLPGNLLCFVSPFKPYMMQIFVKDLHGKTHVFQLLQNVTVSDLEKQILVKFKLSGSEYWLSGPGGNKMANQDKLVDLSTVHIRGRLLGGINKCCIKGCTEDAVSQRRLQCMAGVYELKIAPENLCQANGIPLFVCNHHYYLQKKRGHKPKRFYSSVLHAPQKSLKTKEKTEADDCVSMLGVKTCTSCKKE